MAVAIGLPLLRPAFLGLLAVTAAAMMIGIPGGAFAILGLGFGTYIAGFVTFVMRRLFVTIAELQHARQELARAAVAEERLRFARDLHDLLGHSLSVIVVKAELIRRLATADPSAAETAAVDIETVGRQALVEVRDAVSGYRPAGPAHRDRQGRACPRGCRDRRRRCTFRRATVDARADAILGWAVREGTTNVLRHSGAGRCSITVTTGTKGRPWCSPTTAAAPARPSDARGPAVVVAEPETGYGVWPRGWQPPAACHTPDRRCTATDSPYGTTGFVLSVRLPRDQDGPLPDGALRTARDAR